MVLVYGDKSKGYFLEVDLFEKYDFINVSYCNKYCYLIEFTRFFDIF